MVSEVEDGPCTLSHVGAVTAREAARSGPLGGSRHQLFPRHGTGTYGVRLKQRATSAFQGSIWKLELNWTLGILQAGARSTHHVASARCPWPRTPKALAGPWTP